MFYWRRERFDNRDLSISTSSIDVWQLLTSSPYFIMDVIIYPCWDWNKSMLIKGAIGVHLPLPTLISRHSDLSKVIGHHHSSLSSYRSIIWSIPKIHVSKKVTLIISALRKIDWLLFPPCNILIHCLPWITIPFAKYQLQFITTTYIIYDVNAAGLWKICTTSFNVRGLSYPGITKSIPWLLMPWLLTSPGHQQPWYWLCRIGIFLSYLRKDFNYLRRINVEKLQKILIYVYVPSDKFSM